MNLSRGKSIEITDKPLFDEYFRQFPPEISELTFTNLFIWKTYYNFSFVEWEDHLLIFSQDFFKRHPKSFLKNSDAIFFLPPIGPNPLAIIHELFSSLKPIEIHRVPEVLIEKLRENLTTQNLLFKWAEDRANWDYVYEKEKLISLAGRNLYRKRRWLKRFLEKYQAYEFHLLSDDWLEACRDLQIEWCDLNECRMHEDLLEEQKAITEAFDFYPKLNFRGGLLLVDGKCIAYTLGEKLNSQTVVIHIEKALIDYEGSYQAINNFFVKHCCEDVNYVNREQDLGDLGLQQAKESYFPHHMGKKYVLFKE